MKLNKAELIRCLATVSNTLDEHSAILERQCIHIHDNIVFATTGVMASQSYLPASVDFKCAIHGKKFLEFIKTLKGDEVDVKLNDKQELVVKSGKTSAKFVTSPIAANSTIITESTPISYTKELVEALIECSKVSATEKTDPVLCGVRVEGKTECVIATDRARIAKIDLKSSIGATIPAKFISILSEYQDDIKEATLTDMWGFVIKTDKDVFCTTLLSDEYPNLVQYLPDDTAESLVLEFDKEIIDVLNRHASIVRELDVAKRDTTIAIQDGVATITTANTAVGTLEDEVKIKTERQCIAPFIIDPVIFVNVVDEDTQWRFYTGSKLLLLKNGDAKYYMQSKKED